MNQHTGDENSRPERPFVPHLNLALAHQWRYTESALYAPQQHYAQLLARPRALVTPGVHTLGSTRTSSTAHFQVSPSQTFLSQTRAPSQPVSGSFHDVNNSNNNSVYDQRQKPVFNPLTNQPYLTSTSIGAQRPAQPFGAENSCNNEQASAFSSNRLGVHSDPRTQQT